MAKNTTSNDTSQQTFQKILPELEKLGKKISYSELEAIGVLPSTDLFSEVYDYLESHGIELVLEKRRGRPRKDGVNLPESKSDIPVVTEKSIADKEKKEKKRLQKQKRVEELSTLLSNLNWDRAQINSLELSKFDKKIVEKLVSEYEKLTSEDFDASQLDLQEFGFSEDEVMTFGDQWNDFDMLKLVKYGYLMGNASEELKKEFPEDRITLSNDDEGIYHIIKDIL